MRSRLPPSFYLEEAIFAREQRTVFHDSWQLVAFTHDLQQTRDYVVVPVNGRSVVVQNFDGELNAFENVCLHRQSRMLTEPRGNGPLRCPYHGWTYGSDGVPQSIPNRAQFDPCELQGPSFALRRYAVATCAAFVFLSAASDPLPLADFLGEAWDFVHAVGTGLGACISRYPLTIEANWKFIVENTLEAYHLSHVHPHSLGRLGLSTGEFRFHRSHSTYISPTTLQTANRSRDRLDQAFASRSFKTDKYIHQFLFPNTTIATAHGTSFNVNLIHPAGPQRTDVDVLVFQPALSGLSETQSALVKAMGMPMVELINTIHDEDKVSCELVQSGMRDASRSGILGTEEHRIAAFQSAYLEGLGDT